LPLPSAKKNIQRFENGFVIEDLALGPSSGKLAKAGKKVVVSYVGRLKSNGKIFDKSASFTFRLGKYCSKHVWKHRQ
jgi:FK506-binding nuclear protein